MSFTLTEEQLRKLFENANFTVPAGEMIFFGLRGCSPVDDGGTPFAGAQQLNVLRPDYLHMNCTLGQWLPGTGFAVFPASTVPFLNDVKTAMTQGGQGVNQLASGFYHGAHGYAKGEHKAGIPKSAHRAFRNNSVLPVWRTADDADYEGDDRFETGTAVHDNIHCGYQMNPSSAGFSSNGCQVVAGRPRIPAKGWDIELGPWAKFIANAYSRPQQFFSYALFMGTEAAKAAEPTLQNRPPTVRFGSSGPLVAATQTALIAKGYPLGPAGASGEFDLSTAAALKEFQFKQFGAAGTDLVIGPGTAQALGIAWPGA